jgi:hypothetical protein
MATVRKPFFDPQLLGTSATKIYGDVPSSTVAIIKHLSLKNVTTSNATVTIWVVESGGSAGDSNEAFKRVIAADEDIPVYSLFNEHIETGGSLWAMCSVASAVSIRGGGIEDS